MQLISAGFTIRNILYQLMLLNCWQKHTCQVMIKLRQENAWKRSLRLTQIISMLEEN